ncbi:hypothetical protein M0D21_19015 [Aquimarina sp. D1M17]|uniref:hypothetical protein n=1 Tax=Aquimarina acroporae TaxID=2937283 RepID=UPI0020BD5ED3|nr:hypothetical protein [Aquimarina acroporae]MCK8523683.1 hypothetical protein [Aquimarina acroporae]
MIKIKKIHKIILFFILIFILGIYSFSLYINHTIDQNTETLNQPEIQGSPELKKEAIQIN